ncbi:MAG: hypothetical protein LBI42_06565 [Chitinispirillales bacterium]|jgi:hypothetical protein|nr:hypothetical protein [Chitinispirillales bacterium]
MDTNKCQLLFSELVISVEITWHNLVRSHIVDSEFFCFNSEFAKKAVAHCIEELKNIKPERITIDNRQHHNIAGQMADSIIRYRPIILSKSGYKDIKNNLTNEKLALFFGILYCTHYSKDYDSLKINGFLRASLTRDWVLDLLYRLQKRDYSVEHLAAIFQTFCLRTFNN